MQFIPENDMAFDTNALGFPSIRGCQAICVRSARGPGPRYQGENLNTVPIATFITFR